MTDEAYLLMQIALLRDPESGAIIPHSGGLRKLRWQLKGRGKRGGARIVYYLVREWEMILMLLAYSKKEQDDLTPEQAKILSRLVKEEFK